MHEEKGIPRDHHEDQSLETRASNRKPKEHPMKGIITDGLDTTAPDPAGMKNVDFSTEEAKRKAPIAPEEYENLTEKTELPIIDIGKGSGQRDRLARPSDEKQRKSS